MGLHSANVSPGTYTEQVVIDKDLKLVGKKGAIIKAPSPMVVAGPLNTKSIVRVAGSIKVTIEKFKITGPGDSGCGSLHHGIKVEGGATARITDNHITDIRDQPFSGCQNSQGIFVGRQSESTTGIATILDNVIDEYQKGGIVVDNTGSSATISNNEITGVGPTPTIAQNGIQVSRGAKATVKNNEVSDNRYNTYTEVDASSTGILLFGPGQNVVVNNNSVVNNDVGISSTTFGGPFGEESPVRKLEISKNVVDNSTYDGIDLIDTVNSTVKANKITDSGVDGIFVDVGAVGNNIKDNQMSDSDEHDAHGITRIPVGTTPVGVAVTPDGAFVQR